MEILDLVSKHETERKKFSISSRELKDTPRHALPSIHRGGNPPSMVHISQHYFSPQNYWLTKIYKFDFPQKREKIFIFSFFTKPYSLAFMTFPGSAASNISQSSECHHQMTKGWWSHDHMIIWSYDRHPLMLRKAVSRSQYSNAKAIFS